MKYYQILPLLALLISLAVSAQQPSKFQANVIKQSPNCRRRVTSDATIQVQYTARPVSTNEIVEKKIVELKPGDLTVIKGLEQEIRGMCIGEIRRLTVPAALHVSNDGQISDKAMIYDIEILNIVNPPFLTPTFWIVIGVIGIAYIVFCKLTALEDLKKDLTRGKSK